MELFGDIWWLLAAMGNLVLPVMWAVKNHPAREGQLAPTKSARRKLEISAFVQLPLLYLALIEA